jgi:ABC-type Fe3+/spermidine/putrescine transport system ATPase subunit
LLERLGIDHLAARRPAELSGGEQQRVGLARALARQADLYLLDEPTAHLDTHLRAAFLDSVRERQRDTGAAIIYATHDAGEALALADRVGLVVDGRLVQLTTPQRTYCQPMSEAAARLTGPYSIVTAMVCGHDGELMVDFGEGTVEVTGGSVHGYQPRPRRLMVRPDWVGEGGPFLGIVNGAEFRGPSTDYHLTTKAGPIALSLPGPPRYAIGDSLRWSLRQAWVMPDTTTEQFADEAKPDQSNALIAPA